MSEQLRIVLHRAYARADMLAAEASEQITAQVAALRQRANRQIGQYLRRTRR